VPLCLFAIVWWFRYGRKSQVGRRVASLLAISWTFYVFVFHYLANLPMDDLHIGVQVLATVIAYESHIQARFHMQGHIILFVFVGVGFGYLLQLLGDEQESCVAVGHPKPLTRIINQSTRPLQYLLIIAVLVAVASVYVKSCSIHIICTDDGKI